MSRFDDNGRAGGPRGGSREGEPSSRSDNDKSWRGGGSGGFRDSRGGGGDRGKGYGDRGGSGGGGYGRNDRPSGGTGTSGGSWRGTGSGGPCSSNSSTGQRPRLNLKPRSVDGAGGAPPGGAAAAVAAASGASGAEIKLSKMSLGKGEESNNQPPSEQAPRREPPSVNSRAAALGAAPEYAPSKLRQEGSSRHDRPSDRTPAGPPPVVNKRFEKLAEEEREKREQMRSERRPPEPVGSSRFARQEESRPPPPRETQGPPPPANSRFAAAAAMAQQEGAAERESRPERGGRGPGGGGSYGRERDQGPPAQPGGRFANAAASDPDYVDRQKRDGPGGGPGMRGQGGRGGQGGGFGRDGQPRGSGGYRDRDGQGNNGRDGQGNYGRDGQGNYGRDGQGNHGRDGQGNHGRDGQGNYGRDSRGPGGYGRDGSGPSSFGSSGEKADLSSLPRAPRGREDELPTGPRSSAESQSDASRIDELLKPKKANLATDNVLKVPDAPELAANILKAKPRERDDEDVFFTKPKRAEEKSKETQPEANQPKALAVDPEVSKALLAEFASGNKKGEELKAWVEENRDNLPTVDQLVLALLHEQEKLNPNPECKWAEPDNFGAALLALTSDDIVNQMCVLWGIQFYCSKLGFPKLDGESIVQAMFRGMYKYDLVEEDAFMEWKDDMTESCSEGKLTAITQTLAWFEWLAEADDDDEEDDEEGEREEEE